MGDIVAPDPLKRSCADVQNYGDEVGSGPLLNPQRFEVIGIEDKEFLLRREKEEVRDLLTKSGYTFKNFEGMWVEAVELFRDGKELVSLDAMLYLYGKGVDQRVEENIRG